MEACREHKLLNIINGKIASEKTSVHNALQIGEAMLSKFKARRSDHNGKYKEKYETR